MLRFSDHILFKQLVLQLCCSFCMIPLPSSQGYTDSSAGMMLKLCFWSFAFSPRRSWSLCIGVCPHVSLSVKCSAVLLEESLPEKKKKKTTTITTTFSHQLKGIWTSHLQREKKTIAAVKMLWIRQACVKLFVWSEAVRLVDPVESLHTHIYACVLGGCHRKVPPCGFPSLTSDFHLISSRLSFLPHMFLLHVRTKSTPPTPPYPPPFPPVERERK